MSWLMFLPFLLQNIPASEYAKLFGEFLDAEVLLKVLHVFREFYVR